MNSLLVELRALVGVEDFGTSDTERLFYAMNAKFTIKRRRKLPRDHIATEPIENRRQVDEAT